MTITLDVETAEWLRIEAAKSDMSVSRYVGSLLRQEMRDSHRYQSAMESYLSREARPLRRAGDRYPSREERHEGVDPFLHPPGQLER